MLAPKAIGLVLFAAALCAAGAAAGQPQPAQPAQPIVVEVEEGGFKWLDAGLGAMAGIAASVLVLGVVFAVWRPGEGRTGRLALGDRAIQYAGDERRSDEWREPAGGDATGGGTAR